jgi:ribonuclease HI
VSEAPAPGQGPLLIHVDGACRGNPGEAGFGIHIVDATGATTDLYGYLGRATNNVAEYQALLHALRHALGRNAGRIEVRSDSELMVRQLSGRYGVKNPGLRPLHREALELLRRFESATIRHVPREENREADRLANRALDLRSSSPA